MPARTASPPPTVRSNRRCRSWQMPQKTSIGASAMRPVDLVTAVRPATAARDSTSPAVATRRALSRARVAAQTTHAVTTTSF